MNLPLWMPILAALFGAITHALSTDGGGNVLARLGVTWAIPKSWIGPLVVLFGAGAAVFENVANGLSWQEAAAKGAYAMLAAVFGVLTSQHATGRNGPPPAVAAALLVLFMSGCALLHPAEVIVARDAECLVQHQNLPDEQAFIVCGIAEAERDLAKRQLHVAREESAKLSVAAAAVAAHEAKMGCAK